MKFTFSPEMVEMRLQHLNIALQHKERMFFVESIYKLIEDMRTCTIRYYSQRMVEEIIQSLETINLLIIEEDWVQAATISKLIHEKVKNALTWYRLQKEVQTMQTSQDVETIFFEISYEFMS